MKPDQSWGSSDDGHAQSAGGTLTIGSLRLVLSRQEAFVGDRPIILNYVECQILQLLMEQRPGVVTRAELMMASWGYAPADRASLMDEMVATLQDKLGIEVRIKSFPGIGYALE
jgi:DNA-binding response OmpR family regulator